MPWEVFPGQDPSQVRVVGEANAEHVEDFPFPPLRGAPEIARTLQHQRGIFFNAIGGQAWIHISLHHQVGFGFEVPKNPQHTKPTGLRGGVSVVIHGRYIDQELKALVVLEVLQDVMQVGRLHHQHGAVAERLHRQLGFGECFADAGGIFGGIRHAYIVG